jgi:hypothetical protein
MRVDFISSSESPYFLVGFAFAALTTTVKTCVSFAEQIVSFCFFSFERKRPGEYFRVPAHRFLGGVRMSLSLMEGSISPLSRHLWMALTASLRERAETRDCKVDFKRMLLRWREPVSCFSKHKKPWSITLIMIVICWTERCTSASIWIDSAVNDLGEERWMNVSEEL